MNSITDSSPSNITGIGIEIPSSECLCKSVCVFICSCVYFCVFVWVFVCLGMFVCVCACFYVG